MDAVTLSAGSEGLRREDLAGFFGGWPHPPTLDDRLAILRSTDEVVVCTTADGSVVGFATAITDRRFAAYIPLVEVLPEYQGRGIGSRMVADLLERVQDCYMVDLVCDEDVAPFYERLGGTRLTAVAWRNHEWSSLGEPVRDVVDSFFAEQVEWLRGCVADGQRRGEIRVQGVDPATLARTLFAHLQGSMLLARSDDTFSDMTTTTRELLRHVAGGN